MIARLLFGSSFACAGSLMAMRPMRGDESRAGVTVPRRLLRLCGGRRGGRDAGPAGRASRYTDCRIGTVGIQYVDFAVYFLSRNALLTHVSHTGSQAGANSCLVHFRDAHGPGCAAAEVGPHTRRRARRPMCICLAPLPTRFLLHYAAELLHACARHARIACPRSLPPRVTRDAHDDTLGRCCRVWRGG